MIGKGRAILIAIVICSVNALLRAQQDPVQKGAAALRDLTGTKFTVHLEQRTRWEKRYGSSFGEAKNQQDMLSRLRIGAGYAPAKWFSLSATGQDARAPWYGPNAPATMRESMDLQEAFVALGGNAEPFRASFGRRMLDYGETRVIGAPQWSNTSRTYDFGRVQWNAKRFTLEALLVSPVIILPDSFNNPEFGNRYWGSYNVFPSLWRGLSVDVYALRHSQNKIGGWTGGGGAGTNNYGARFYGPLPGGFAYSLEGIAQNGHLGALDQRAYAWYAGLTRPLRLPRLPIDTLIEYKEASGSHDGETHSSTFDQLTPANHDKFGHEDLFGFKNLRAFKTLETLHPIRALAFNIMYTHESLFSATDSLYASAGSKIATSMHGAAGHGVGQELDGFATYTWGPHMFLAGFGHFFRGPFVAATTPGINPRYFYVSQQYTIK